MTTMEPGKGMDRPAEEPISLWGECGEFSMPGSLWRELLTLAQDYGWKPRGTLPPLPGYAEFSAGGQDGSYFPPEGQRMTRDDAHDFADALEQLLLDIPDGCEPNEESDRPLFASWRDESLSVKQRLATVRSGLQDLVVHCRKCAEFWLY